MESKPSQDVDLILRNVQAGSGLAFSLFAGLHATNALFAFYSRPAYNDALNTFRQFYRPPLLEACLVGIPLAVHVGTSLARRVLKISRTGKIVEGRVEDLKDPIKLQRFSGHAVIVPLAVHLAALRIPQAYKNVRVEFCSVNDLLLNRPLIYFPVFTGLAFFGLLHAVNGARLGLHYLGFLEEHPKALPKWVLGLLGCLAAGIPFAFAGVFHQPNCYAIL